MHCKRKPHVLREGQYVEVKLFPKLLYLLITLLINLRTLFTIFVTTSLLEWLQDLISTPATDEEVSLSNSYKVVKYHYGAH